MIYVKKVNGHTLQLQKSRQREHTHKRFIPSSKVLMCDSENYILY